MNLFKDVNPFQLSYGPLDAPTIIFQTHVDLLSFEIKPIWQRRINNNITIQPHGVIRSTNLHILINNTNQNSLSNTSKNVGQTSPLWA